MSVGTSAEGCTSEGKGLLGFHRSHFFVVLGFRCGCNLGCVFPSHCSQLGGWEWGLRFGGPRAVIENIGRWKCRSWTKCDGCVEQTCTKGSDRVTNGGFCHRLWRACQSRGVWLHWGSLALGWFCWGTLGGQRVLGASGTFAFPLGDSLHSSILRGWCPCWENAGTYPQMGKHGWTQRPCWSQLQLSLWHLLVFNSSKNIVFSI